jgi:hypothetical protein
MTNVCSHTWSLARKWCARRGLLLLCAIIMAARLAVAADHDRDNRGFEIYPRTCAIGLWGGLTYSDVQAQVGVPNMIADMNRQNRAFTVHDVDLKAGSGTPGSVSLTTCVDALYTQGLGYFNSLGGRHVHYGLQRLDRLRSRFGRRVQLARAAGSRAPNLFQHCFFARAGSDLPESARRGRFAWPPTTIWWDAWRIGAGAYMAWFSQQLILSINIITYVTQTPTRGNMPCATPP